MHSQTTVVALIVALDAAADRRGIADRADWAGIRSALAGWGESSEMAQRIDDNLDALAAVFGLGAVERDLLLVAAAVDIDPTLAAAYGVLTGADAPRAASVALALELAGVGVAAPVGRVALSAAAPLRRWGLITEAAGPWALGRALSVDETVTAALLGATAPDPVAAAMTVPAGDDDGGLEDFTDDPHGDAGIGATPGLAELTAALAAGHRLCWVENPPGGAGVTIGMTAFARADIRCVTVDLARRPADVAPDDALRIAIRHAGVHRAGLLVDSAELLAKSADGAAAVGVAATSPVPIVLVGSCRWNATWHRVLPVTVRAAPAGAARRLATWRRYVDPAQISDAALMPYRLTPEQIEAVGRHVAEHARVFDRPPDPQLIAESVRMLGGSTAVRSGLGWAPTTFDDLQVPAETRAELERLASWVRLRDTVTSGGAVQGLGGKGTGIAALFTGSPGTGKTLSAHVIADTAGLDLMQVDLSGVVDKYIGETEKNLERVFADAENLNVVLFFDEADSLFGKRSEVRDAHDRFANQEVSYLLQRMEQFDGITVLATNLKGNLDVAFSRRLHFIIHFPDPDEATRVRLWTQLLRQAGPPDPVDPVDVPRLAAALELSGGDIRNIVLSAVYDAAAAGAPVGMRLVAAAAAREYAKLGRRVPSGLG
jgi:hypothetical protein